MPVRLPPLYNVSLVRKSFFPTLKPHLMSPAASSSASPRTSPQQTMTRLASSNGDLNNQAAARPVTEIAVDAAFLRQSLAIPECDDDLEVRQRYRPFLLPDEIANSDWIASLEMATAMKMAYEEMHRVNGGRLRVLVLYGSLRERYVTSYRSIDLRCLVV